MWKTHQIIYTAAESVLSAVSLPANGLVLLALLRHRHLRTITNLFIGSLALADLLVSIIVAPTSATSVLGLPDNFYGCIFINCLVIILTNIAILTVLVVSAERLVAVQFPVWHRATLNKRKALVLVGVAWLAGTMLGLVPLMGWHEPRANFEHCSFVAVISLTYMVYLNFLGMVLPCLLTMMVVYVRIFLTFRKRLKRLRSVRISNVSAPEISSTKRVSHKELTMKQMQGGVKMKRMRRGIKCMAAVCSVFAICWLPLHTSNSLIVFFAISRPLNLELAFVVLSHATSAIHPFIYAFFIKAFQNNIKGMLQCTRFVKKHTLRKRDYSPKHQKKESTMSPGVTVTEVSLTLGSTSFKEDNYSQSTDCLTQHQNGRRDQTAAGAEIQAPTEACSRPYLISSVHDMTGKNTLQTEDLIPHENTGKNIINTEAQKELQGESEIKTGLEYPGKHRLINTSYEEFKQEHVKAEVRKIDADHYTHRIHLASSGSPSLMSSSSCIGIHNFLKPNTYSANLSTVSKANVFGLIISDVKDKKLTTTPLQKSQTSADPSQTPSSFPGLQTLPESTL